MKLVFIAGPYFGDGQFKTIEDNIQEAEFVAIELANRQVPFFCAHLHTRHFETKAQAPEDFYRMQDMLILQRAADGVLFLPRWRESHGAIVEHAESIRLGKKIFYLRSLNDRETLDIVELWVKKTY